MTSRPFRLPSAVILASLGILFGCEGNVQPEYSPSRIEPTSLSEPHILTDRELPPTDQDESEDENLLTVANQPLPPKQTPTPAEGSHAGQELGTNDGKIEFDVIGEPPSPSIVIGEPPPPSIMRRQLEAVSTQIEGHLMGTVLGQRTYNLRSQIGNIATSVICVELLSGGVAHFGSAGMAVGHRIPPNGANVAVLATTGPGSALTSWPHNIALYAVANEQFTFASYATRESLERIDVHGAMTAFAVGIDEDSPLNMSHITKAFAAAGIDSIPSATSCAWEVSGVQ
jgi:hypothetical protein